MRRYGFGSLVALHALVLDACQPFSAGSSDSGGQPGESGAAGSSQAGASTAGANAAGSSNGGSAGDAMPGAGTSSAGSAGLGAGGASAGAGGAIGIGGSVGMAGAPSSCPCAAPTPTCELGKCISRGPKMVKATSFYIDSTEVTNGQYAVFEAAKGADESGQLEECKWNTSYDPTFDPTAGMTRPNQPVTNVDWCDAAAYCTWADKQLCSKIGGGELQLAELADSQKSQWYLACAGPKSQSYPYGPDYRAGACNDGTKGAQLSEVAKFDQCQGFFPNLFDMLGNAQEWVAACVEHTGEHDTCERIGGSYLSTKVCSDSGAAERSATAPQVGFRCCSK